MSAVLYVANCLFSKNMRLQKAIQSLLQVIAGSCLLALCAQIAIPLPFTPVPLTLQSAMVIILGMTLGSRLGAVTVALYVLEGCLGLPVFSYGQSGAAWLLGPTGGYLIGFIAAAYLAGVIQERMSNGKWTVVALSYVVANMTILFFGACHLSAFVGWDKAFVCGILPFILGDCVKGILFVSSVAKTRWGQERLLIKKIGE